MREIVRWNSSYSVKIKLIDEQHIELIRLTNKLFNSCMAGQKKSLKAFLETIHEVVEYASYHFGTEEKIMERINYPHYTEHKAEHVSFAKEVFIRVEDYRSGKITAPLSLVYYLRDWVLHHIAVNDKKLGDYLLKLRKSGELQKMTLKVKNDEALNRVVIK